MSPRIIKYLNFLPNIENNVVGSKTSIIIGNTFIGDSTKLKKNVIIRGDGKEIHIGKNCLLKNRVTVHVAARLFGTYIGDNCIIDEYSIIHACKLEDNVLVGSNSVIMDGSEIGNNVVVANNSLIPPGKKYPPYTLVAGSPAKIIRKINKKDYLNYKNSLLYNNKFSFFSNTFNYRKFLNKKLCKSIASKINTNSFVADDVNIDQKITLGRKSSIWFSVIILSRKKNGEVILGTGSNIQDNSIINTLGDVIRIGKRVTVGHNVIMIGKSNVKNDAVIGMGSIIEKDCIIGKNSFVGANSHLVSKTVVPDNTIFAGKPARFFRKVKEKEKTFFKNGQKIYEELTKNYLSIKK